MEDFVGIIIYLLIAVIGILASVYRQKNKRRALKPPPVPTTPVDAEVSESYETESDPFAGFFDEKPAVPEQDYVTAEEENEVREIIAEEKAESKNLDEGEAVFKEIKETLISDDIQYESPDVFAEVEYGEGSPNLLEDGDLTKDHTKPLEEKEEFDLKKAIIYSEILKRRENW
jgi:hypothetical protein